ncbi:MAG: PEP-CTERM sorting domain-containing protein [Gammaproteobacteria bacterium]|nr:PEP-CTERM sorting domain-containing protein [Gammaproteobacteria bacterium]
MNLKQAFVAAVVAVSANSASAIVIDDFDTGSGRWDGIVNNVAAGTTGTGFARTITTDEFPVVNALTVQINDGPLLAGLYAHSQDSGLTGISTISYDLNGFDFSADNGFSVDITSVDITFDPTRSGVLTLAVDGVSVSQAMNDIAPLSSGVAYFLFSDFAGVDFSNVATVDLTIDGTNLPALDATIDNFISGCFPNIPGAGSCGGPPAQVPAPGSLALLGLGFGLLGLRGVRAKR